MGQDEQSLQFDVVFARLKKCTEINSSTDLAKILGISTAAVSKQKVQNKFPAAWAIQIAHNRDLDLNFVVFGKESIPRTVEERDLICEAVRIYLEKKHPESTLINNESIYNIIVADVIGIIEKYILIANTK